MLNRRHLYLPWIAAAVIVTLACSPSAPLSPAEQAEPAPADPSALAQPATPPGGPGDSEELTSVECYSGFLVQTSFEELERDATTIVIGTGTGESRPMQEPDYFGVVYQVEVERYLKGAGPDMLPIYQTEGCLVTVRGKQFRGPIGDALSPIREGARYLFFLRPHPYQPEETLHVLYGPVLRAMLRPSRFVLDGGRASPDSSWPGASKYFPAMPESDLIVTVEEVIRHTPALERTLSGVGSFFPYDAYTSVPVDTLIKFTITRPEQVILLHLEPDVALDYTGDEAPDKPSQIRVYKPQTDLASGTTYTATVEWGNTDPGPDNENRRTASWSFTTAP